MSTTSIQSMTNHHDEGFFKLLAEKIQDWHVRRQQRAELSHFSERDLHDIGLSWSEMMYEVEKPFWQA